jgi:hypothetical protein
MIDFFDRLMHKYCSAKPKIVSGHKPSATKRLISFLTDLGSLLKILLDYSLSKFILYVSLNIGDSPFLSDSLPAAQYLD